MAHLNKNKGYLFIKDELKTAYSLAKLKSYADKYSFNANGYYVEDIALLKKKTPFISQIRIDGRFHFIIVKKMTKKKVHLYDPSIGNEKIDIDAFKNKMTGYVLVIKSKTNEDIKYNPPFKKSKIFCYLFSKILSFISIILTFFYIKNYLITIPLLIGTFILECINYQIKIKTLKEFDEAFITNKNNFLIAQKIKETFFNRIDNFTISFSILSLTVAIFIINEKMMLVILIISIFIQVIIFKILHSMNGKISKFENKEDMFKDALELSYKTGYKMITFQALQYFINAILIFVLMKLNNYNLLNYFMFYFVSVAMATSKVQIILDSYLNKDEYLNLLNLYYDKK